MEFTGMEIRKQKILYAPDTTMQAMLSDRYGRVLLIEPGIGYRLEQKQYSLMTNYSVLKPESTRPYIVPGDDRYERAQAQLEKLFHLNPVSGSFRQPEIILYLISRLIRIQAISSITDSLEQSSRISFSSFVL